MKEMIVAQQSIYRYNLYDGIDSFNDIGEFVENMASYQHGDAVMLYINSPGGSIDVGLSIIDSIKQCKAPVTAVVQAPSYSMASVAALACDNIVFLKHTYLMFHNYSIGTHGKGAEFMMSTKHNDEHINAIFKEYCSPFLTAAEMKKVSSDSDVYIKWDDPTLDKRIARHFKRR